MFKLKFFERTYITNCILIAFVQSSIVFGCCSVAFAQNFTFTAGGGLSPNEENFPNNPLNLTFNDAGPSFLSVQSGTMSALNGGGTVTNSNNGFSRGVSVAVGATVDYSGAGLFSNTINLTLGNSDEDLSIQNSGIIRQNPAATNGNAIFMNFQQSSGINVVQLQNSGLIDGNVTITNSTDANSYFMNPADPSVNNGVTEITGLFKNFNGTTTMRIGQSSTTNFAANGVQGVAGFTLGNSSSFTINGAITGVSQSFTIPSGCKVFFNSAGSFASSSSFTNNAGGHLNIGNTFVIATAAGGGFTNSGNLYVYNAGSGGITGNISSGQTLTVGRDANNNNYLSTIYTTGGTIANIPIVTIANGVFNLNNSVSGVGSSFTINSGAQANINATLSGNGTFTITSGATATINPSGAVSTTGAFNNAGNLNIAGPFNPVVFASFTNTGALFLVGAGTINSNLTTGTSLSVGRDSNGNANACTFNNTSTISLASINIYNGSSIANTGGGSVSGNVYVLGTGTFSGTVSGPILTIGRDSFNNNDGTTNFSAGSAISGFPTISVINGSFSNNGFAFSNINTNFTIANGASATLSGSFSGTTSIGSNSGTLNLQSSFALSNFTNNNLINFQTGAVNATPITNASGGNIIVVNNSTNNATITNGGTITINALLSGSGTITNNNTLAINSSFSGLVTNDGNIEVAAAFNPANNSTNSGIININNGGSFVQPGIYTYTGTINVNTGTNPVGSALTGGAGSILNIGNSGAVSFTSNNNISSIPTINVLNSSTFVANNPIAGVTTNFTNSASSSTTFNAAYSGSGAVNNSGSMTITNTFSSGTITNNNGASLFLASGAFSISSNIVNILGGQITVNSQATVAPSFLITNSGTMNINSTFSSDTITNTSTGQLFLASGINIIDSNIINQASGQLTINSQATLDAASTISNGGSMSINAAFSSGLITNTSTGQLLLGSGVNIISSDIVNQSGGQLTINSQATVNVLNTISNAGSMDINAEFSSGTITNTGQLLLASGANIISSNIVNQASGQLDINSQASVNSINTISNGGTMNINAEFSSGTITNTSTGQLFLASGANTISSSIVNQASGQLTINSQATVNPANTISNSGFMNINSTFSSGLITNANGGQLILASGANTIASNITNNSNGQLLVTSLATSTGTITNNGTMAISAQLAGSGTITNNSILNFNSNAEIAKTIVNAASGNLNVNANTTCTAPINNNGSLLYAADISMPTQTLTNSGNIIVSGQRTLVAANYNSTGTHITSITNVSTADQLDITGAASLSGGTLQVNSSFNGQINTLYQWPVITTTGGITAPTSTILPSSDWSASVIGNNLVVQFLTSGNDYISNAQGEVNESIAAVISEMANNITNEGQAELIDDINEVLNTNSYNSALHQLMPSINAGSVVFGMQNILYNRAIARASVTGFSSNLTTGIATGNVSTNVSIWMSAVGDYIKQKSRGENDGYTATSLGGLFGIDTLLRSDAIVGAAFAFTNANVNELSNSDFKTKVMTYYGLLYGADNFGRNFYEWVIGAGTNKNKGNRRIIIGSNNLSVNSSYRGLQAGGKINLGSCAHIANWLGFSHIISLQYSWLHQPSYNEDGSVAALHVENNINQDILTVGTGVRFNIPTDNPWLFGKKEIHANVTYDVINSDQLTIANFLVGSNNFVITNVPVRLGLDVGVDYALTICDTLQIQASYDFQYRNGYYNQMALLKLRYIF